MRKLCVSEISGSGKLKDLQESYRKDGYVILKNVVRPDIIQCLQGECNTLLARNSLLKKDLISDGCVLDLFDQIWDYSKARTNANEYSKFRLKQGLQITTELQKCGIDKFSDVKFCAHGFESIALCILNADSVYLFNENYVVKPPKSSVQFRWHTVIKKFQNLVS